MTVAEQAETYARRVITALIGPTNKARSVVAGRILDDLKGLDVNVSGRPGQEIEVRLMLLLTRETAEAVLRAVSPAAPVERPAWHIRDGYEGPAPAAPFAGLDMSDAETTPAGAFDVTAMSDPAPVPEGHWVDGPTSKLCPAHGGHPHRGTDGDIRQCLDCPTCYPSSTLGSVEE